MKNLFKKIIATIVFIICPSLVSATSTNNCTVGCIPKPLTVLQGGTGANFFTANDCVAINGTADAFISVTCPTVPGSHFMINIGLGFASGTVSTMTIYPFQQIPDYTNATITKIRVACANGDSSTSFQVSDVTSNTIIGTVTLSGNTTATYTLPTPYALVSGHVLNTTVTNAGTATNCGLTAQGQASTF